MTALLYSLAVVGALCLAGWLAIGAIMLRDAIAGWWRRRRGGGDDRVAEAIADELASQAEPDRNVERLAEAEEAEAVAAYRLMQAAEAEADADLVRGLEVEYRQRGMSIARDVVHVIPAATNEDEGCTCGYADGELWVGMRTGETTAIWDGSCPDRRSAHTQARRLRRDLAESIGWAIQRTAEEAYERGRSAVHREKELQALGDHGDVKAASKASG